jgi:putative transposase
MFETFHLAPPPHFRGIEPNKPISVYFRHMPHWRQDGATYFVTFRLGDSLPHEKLEYLKRLREEWDRVSPALRTQELNEQFSKNHFRQMELSLDEGHGACHFQNQAFAEVLRSGLLQFHGERYFLGCWAIMPNHCHLVIRPHDGLALEKLLQSLKGAVARTCNQLLSTAGKLWQDESYDRIVRDEEHLWRIIQYIGRNPSKAGLAKVSWRRWINPDWQAAGWSFVEP